MDFVDLMGKSVFHLRKAAHSLYFAAPRVFVDLMEKCVLRQTKDVRSQNGALKMDFVDIFLAPKTTKHHMEHASEVVRDVKNQRYAKQKVFVGSTMVCVSQIHKDVQTQRSVELRTSVSTAHLSAVYAEIYAV
jgi:hypothetical protein